MMANPLHLHPSRFFVEKCTKFCKGKLYEANVVCETDTKFSFCQVFLLINFTILKYNYRLNFSSEKFSRQKSCSHNFLEYNKLFTYF